MLSDIFKNEKKTAAKWSYPHQKKIVQNEYLQKN